MKWVGRNERPIDPPNSHWDGHDDDEGNQDAADDAKEQEMLDETDE